MASRTSDHRSDDTFPCPHCGADVPEGSSSCSECGSDDQTGWAEDADVWASNIPTGYAQDDEFDYDEYADRDLLPYHHKRLRTRLKTLLWLVAIVILIIAFVCLTTGIRP